ncbi:hypothetical protein EOD29_23820 [Mesorhizobium sp. M1A.T.Ca.IN.004.03.1.1]|uniref:hypothetical protein n=1 Tax=Mesorhizobium sp. M1A.T.Ca.IN.004.03.1.1 TaxID=2496795 RepID=UPI000FCCC18D|nr:hypothetical protein [Mesorhizobium sp. M1A.T.Ca.IN.004.03.1.1]RUV41185.1 hypothetical protein EOD29_23820 [Mesorhizobium sp. M1A.T.Ca.IN.004.03.1.1]
MRTLPKDIDADAVIEISRLLADRADVVPLPIHDLVKEIRRSIPTKLSDNAIEELVVEMAAARGLPMIFDKPPA